MPKLVRMFKTLGLAVKIENRDIYLEQQTIPQDVLDNIVCYRAENREAYENSSWRRWKYFAQRNHGPKIDTFCLETGVAALVKP